ncbi:hypothetical protein HELRODRAFT_63913, partial [Helobdella robusta]|uniref:Protein Wnt n=1 Tax=Helobdella robusta TaxID=6412 RepID=T1FXM4_HELRO
LYDHPHARLLSKRQNRLILNHHGSLRFVARAARLAVDECARQMAYRRWNCSVVTPLAASSLLFGRSLFGKITNKGRLETSYLQSLTSASLMHSIAQGCSSNMISGCSCGALDHHPNDVEWRWDGCNDNDIFGSEFTREFIDRGEKYRDLKSGVLKHNSRAGRQHVLQNMQKECKCHGMSGTCSLKTCWMKMPSISLVAAILKEKFNGATKVDQGLGNSHHEHEKRRLLPHNPEHKKPTKFDLVYYEDSPTFCDPDPSLGYPGVKGRKCIENSMGMDGCDVMCCGRGYKKVTVREVQKCNCSFVWCCDVTCDYCDVVEERFVCE